MKKLAFDSSNWKLIGTINDLIDLVNSQQEAIERLQDHVDHEARHVSEPADDKIEYMEESQTLTKEQMEWIEERVNKDLRNTSATHRTVTLRIPKGMRIGQAIDRATVNVYQLYQVSDTDLQKALDEVEHE